MGRALLIYKKGCDTIYITYESEEYHMSAYLMPSDILLPDFETVDGSKWAVVACDQHTSEPEYWQKVSDRVADEPSTLNLILPEAFLEKGTECVPGIHANMQSYLHNLLVTHKNKMIYLERTQSDGCVRRGLVGMIDLEQYDFTKSATSLIRATEGTVIDRIPPRLEIRHGAVLEAPHVMLLVDDAEKTVIEPVAERAEALTVAYDFDLADGAGHVKGYFVESIDVAKINAALSRLATPEYAAEHYGEGTAPLLFAVGDGNHSLATAKVAYEQIKEQYGERAKYHPARYALVEVVNLHDEALRFEPIYRVLFNVDVDDVLKKLQDYSFSLDGECEQQKTKFVSAGRRGAMHFGHPTEKLVVGTLQKFIDAYLAEHPEASVDYIHGTRAVEELCHEERRIGFVYAGIAKDQLFPTVATDGVLPRKAFSMGTATDKRYYVECRKIQ